MSKKSISSKIRIANKEILKLKEDVNGYYINMKTFKHILSTAEFIDIVTTLKKKEKRIKSLRGRIAELNRKSAKQ